MKPYRNTLGGNTLLKLGLGVTLVIVVASAVSYYLIYKEIEQGVREQISQYVVQRAKSLEANFLLAQDMHQVFKRELLGSLAQPPSNALRRFDELFMRYPDGAIRSRPKHIGVPPHITGWINKDVDLTREMRRRFVLYYDLARRFTPIALVRFHDLWISAPEQIYIGYDPPDLPIWVSNLPADYDMNALEAVSTANRAHGSDRQTLWSGVYIDPIWKIFLVPVSTPVDYHGRHVFTIHNDIALDDLMASTLKSDLEGAAHAVFQADGRLVAYKGKMRAIRNANGHYFVQDSGDPRLLSLLDAVRGTHSLPVTDFDPQADQYLAISRLNGPDWYFATIVPGNLVRAQAFESAQWVLWTGLISLTLVLAILAVVIRRQIALPLRRLLTATLQMRKRQALAPLDVERQDELGRLADAFAQTATSIEQEFQQRAQALQHEMDERKRAYEALHDSELRYQMVAEQTGHLLYDYDIPSGKIRWTGPIQRLTGFAADEFQDVDIARWEQLVHPEDRSAAMTELARAQAETAKYLVEYRLRRADDSYVYMEDEGAFISGPDGKAARMLGTVRDISERKRALAAIQQAKEAADSANRAKSLFLANMSHELRTPLNGILGYAQILRRGDPLTEKQRNGVQVIYRSGEHLLGLINHILDLAKIEAGKLEINALDFDLLEFLHDIDAIFKLRGADKGLRFTERIDPGLPRYVRGDKQKLHQVLSNLIGNAVKFTGRGEIVFDVQREGERIRFNVTDTGCGIDAEDQELIFQPFQQARESVRLTEGTGLGLTIGRSMVELMGGELKVRSEPGRGSTFWFSILLPAAAATESVPPRALNQITGYRGPRRRVLVVDDTPENRAVLIDMLEPLGFEILEAENGETALAKTHRLKPDLVLMDIRMPVMDGLEATRRIRALPALQEVVVVAISASVFGHDQDKCLQAGANDFLPKPFSQHKLMELIARRLGLEWIEADEATDQHTAAPAQTVSREAMIVPPAEELEVLKELTLRGDVAQILNEAGRLERLDERYASFADELRQLANRFQLTTIDRILNGARQHA